MEAALPSPSLLFFKATDADGRTMGYGGGALPLQHVWQLKRSIEVVDPRWRRTVGGCGFHVCLTPWQARTHLPFPAAVVWAVAVPPFADIEAADVTAARVSALRPLRPLTRAEEQEAARGIVELWGPHGSYARFDGGALHADPDTAAPSRVTANGSRRWHVHGALHRGGGKPAVEESGGLGLWLQHGQWSTDCPCVGSFTSS